MSSRFMDTVFLLGDGERAAFLQQMMHSFGCLHICLWSYLPHPSNCLLAMDGLYRESSNLPQPSSSSAQLARQLFDAYRELVNYVDSGEMRIPGYAFKNGLFYTEVKVHDFQKMASHDVQLQFYKEAGIKTVVFMGCAAGEIELGMSNDSQVIDLEKEMKNLFPADFSRQGVMSTSSSSSLRSVSADSTEHYSPLMLNIIRHSQEPVINREALLEETLKSLPLSTPLTITTPTYSSHQNTNFPITLEVENAAMTQAILAVLTSPSTSSTNIKSRHNLLLHNRGTAFTRYGNSPTQPGGFIGRKQNMFKRAVLFFRNLSMRRKQEIQAIQGRPTATQMQHMISERRRREKLNESFQALRSLLPSGTKKDKVSVLSSTIEYLSSLKSEVDELSRRNQMLESQNLTVQRLPKTSDEEDDETGSHFSSVDQRVYVEITQVSSSVSETRFLDLRVRVRSSGEVRHGMSDLVIDLLEFLRLQRNVSVSSLESNTRMLGSVAVHELVMRLKIEGEEFDESGFREAVTVVVEDQQSVNPNPTL